MQNYLCLCYIHVLYLIHFGTVITEGHTTLKKHLIQEHYSMHTKRPNQVRPIVSAGKHLSNTNLSDLSIMGTSDIFVYRKRHQIM